MTSLCMSSRTAYSARPLFGIPVEGSELFFVPRSFHVDQLKIHHPYSLITIHDDFDSSNPSSMEITRGMLDVLIFAMIWSFFLSLFKAGVHVKFVFDVVRHGLSANLSFTFQATLNPYI